MDNDNREYTRPDGYEYEHPEKSGHQEETNYWNGYESQEVPIYQEAPRFREDPEYVPIRKKRGPLAGCLTVLIILIFIALGLFIAGMINYIGNTSSSGSIFTMAQSYGNDIKDDITFRLLKGGVAEEDELTKQICEALEARAETVTLRGVDPDSIKEAMTKVQTMPDYFYMDGHFTYRQLSGSKYMITFSYKYDNIDLKQTEIDNVVSRIISQIPEGADNFEKLLTVHDWLCEHITYEFSDDGSDQDIYGALVKRQCVCSGYTKAFAYILDKLEIPNEIVLGTGTDSEGNTEEHAWNKVILGGNPIYFDVTWDDANETYGTEYFYFGITDQEMLGAHTPRTRMDASVPSEYDYYTRNGYVLGSSSDSQLAAIVAAQRNGVVRIKCSDEATYQYLISYISGGQKLFRMFNTLGISASRVQYYVRNDVRCISIYYS